VAIVKDIKTKKICIENNVFYLSKKSITQVSRSIYNIKKPLLYT
jgi:hypothetical protein